jgi:hypothetical protein
MRSSLTCGAALALTAATFAQTAPPASACPRCRWTPPAGRSVEVRSLGALEQAVAGARAGDTILLADGEYTLRTSLEIRTPKLTIRGRSGDPAKVVLHGQGMTGDPVGVAVAVGAPDVTIADVTIREVRYHAVQVRGERGASGFTLHNARLFDAGQQLLKGSVSEDRVQADRGLVACSEFGYTTSAPSDYTNGIDILRTDGWVIRDNRLLRIRGPESNGWRAGPAILAWMGSQDTLVERNTIVDSFRGIALGLDPGARPLRLDREYDHLRGIVRDNTVVNLNPWADEGIEANDARDVRIERNIVATAGAAPWSIGVRFPRAFAVVADNVTTRQILLRDGGRAVLERNVLMSAPVSNRR